MEMQSQVQRHSVGPYHLLNLNTEDQIRKVACQDPKSDQALEAIVVPMRNMKSRKDSILALTSVMSEYVQKVMDIRSTQRNTYIICEKPCGLPLHQYFHGPVDLLVIKEVLRNCLKGLAVLHMQLICHGNLSPATIYINSVTFNVKLCGFAAISREQQEPDLEYYQAPEVLRGQSPSQSSDIYSLGCIAAFLETGRNPFSPKHCPYRDQSLSSLVCQMARESPASRPSAEKLLAHPFLALCTPRLPSSA